MIQSHSFSIGFNSRLLAETGDSVELVEASDMVPGLKFRRGVTRWVVSDKIGNIYKHWSEVPEKIHSLIRPTMFPPPPEEAEQFHMVTDHFFLKNLFG